MKLGTVLTVIGILLLLVSIPYSIFSIVFGFNQLAQNNITGGFSAWLPLIGVVLGLILTAIGVTRLSIRRP